MFKGWTLVGPGDFFFPANEFFINRNCPIEKTYQIKRIQIMNLTFKVKTDFHNKSSVMIHFLFPEKIQLKINIEKRKTFYRPISAVTSRHVISRTGGQPSVNKSRDSTTHYDRRDVTSFLKWIYIDVNERCFKLMLLLLTPFSSYGKSFEQILVK